MLLVPQYSHKAAPCSTAPALQDVPRPQKPPCLPTQTRGRGGWPFSSCCWMLGWTSTATTPAAGTLSSPTCCSAFRELRSGSGMCEAGGGQVTCNQAPSMCNPRAHLTARRCLTACRYVGTNGFSWEHEDKVRAGSDQRHPRQPRRARQWRAPVPAGRANLPPASVSAGATCTSLGSPASRLAPNLSLGWRHLWPDAGAAGRGFWAVLEALLAWGADPRVFKQKERQPWSATRLRNFCPLE